MEVAVDRNLENDSFESHPRYQISRCLFLFSSKDCKKAILSFSHRDTR